MDFFMYKTAYEILPLLHTSSMAIFMSALLILPGWEHKLYPLFSCVNVWTVLLPLNFSLSHMAGESP